MLFRSEHAIGDVARARDVVRDVEERDALALAQVAHQVQEPGGDALFGSEPEGAQQEPESSKGPQIPFDEIMGMAKRAKNKDQADVLIDALNDPGYTDAQRSDVKMILNSKSFAGK